MKRSTLRKKSKAPISRIQRKLWELCKQIVRLRDKHICYTCGRRIYSKFDLQTGHMWAKASLGAYLKYDLRVLRIQCFVCNIHRGGMGADFYKKMLKEIGPEQMAQLEKDRQVLVRAYDHYVKLIEEYTELLKTYESRKNRNQTTRTHSRGVRKSAPEGRRSHTRDWDISPYKVPEEISSSDAEWPED